MNVYPVKYGFKVSVRIERNGNTAEVYVLAPMYKNKEWKMPHCYASSFSDDEILKDHNFGSVMLKHYS